jgi:hypothetical protein
VSCGFGISILLLLLSGGKDAVDRFTAVHVIGSLILGDFVQVSLAGIANSLDEFDKLFF